MKKEFKFQLKLVQKLQKSHKYQDASIYTILLELCLNNNIDDIKELLKSIEKEINKYR